MSKYPESVRKHLKEKFTKRKEDVGNRDFVSISELKLDIHEDAYEEYRRTNGYYSDVIKEYDTRSLNSNNDVFEFSNKANDLLIKLFHVASELDYAYLDAIKTGGKSSFTGEKYDELNDVLVEVEEFLGIK